MLTIVDATLQELSRLLQGRKLLLGEEGVVGAVALVRPRRPRRHRHRAQVQVVTDRVLQLVVQPALREPRVQVLPQVGRYRTWKRSQEKMVTIGSNFITFGWACYKDNEKY